MWWIMLRLFGLFGMLLVFLVSWLIVLFLFYSRLWCGMLFMNMVVLSVVKLFFRCVFSVLSVLKLWKVVVSFISENRMGF